MTGLPFARPAHLRDLAWTLTLGSAQADYGVARLSDRNPEEGLWITGTSVGLQADQGAALPLAGLAIIHHRWREGTRLRLRMHPTASWAGPTDVEIVTIVGAWHGLFAPHVYVDVAGRYAEAARTKRYVHLDALDANDVDVQIGELVPVVQVEALTRGVLYAGGGLQAPVSFGRHRLPTKTGSAWTHDPRIRARAWSGGLVLGADTSDRTRIEAWQHDARGVRNFLVWPEGLAGEPIYAEFVDAAYRPAMTDPAWVETPFAVQEIACGEAY